MPRIADLIATHSSQIEVGASLAQAAALMLARQHSSVIVMRDGKALGIITEFDILRAMRQHRDLQQPVTELMTTPVHTVPAGMDFRAAYQEANRLGIRHLVVIDQAGSPLGVASETEFRHHLGPDFFRHLNDVDSLMIRDFPRFAPDQPLDEALQAMLSQHASCAVITDQGKPIGILTERDVVRLFLEAHDNPPLRRVMTHPVHSILADTSLADASERMAALKIRHLVAVDRQGSVVGLISEHTLMRPLELDLLDDATSERLSLLKARDSAQEARRLQERYQRAMLDNFPFLVWLKDTHSRFLSANQALANALQVSSPEALIGRCDADFAPDDLASHYVAEDQATMRDGKQRTVIELIQLHDKRIWHETFKAPIFAEDGSLLGTVGFAQDITARRRAEEAMLLRNAALAGLIRGEPLQATLELFALAIEAEHPDWSCAILSITADKTRLKLEAAPRLDAAFSQYVSTLPIRDNSGSCGTAAFRMALVITEDIAQDPAWREHQDLARQQGFQACWSNPIIGHDGQLLGILAAYQPRVGAPDSRQVQDLVAASQLAALILSHQQHVDTLHQGLDTFRGIVDQLGDALFILTPDGHLLDVNSGAETLLDTPRAEQIGRHYQELAVTGMNNLADLADHFEAARQGVPRQFELWVQGRAGHPFPCDVRLKAVDYFGQTALVAVVSDISERKHAELRLSIEHDLASTTTNDLTEKTIFQRILMAALRMPELDAGMIYQRTPQGDFELIAQHGLSSGFANGIRRIGRDTPEAQRLQDDKTVCGCHSPCEHCNDLALVSSPLMQAEGLHCLIMLPISSHGEPIACLALASHVVPQVSPATLTTLGHMTQYFSQTLLRLQAQAESRSLQDNLNGLFETLTDFIFVIGPDERILHHNRAVTEHLGYAEGSLIGQSILSLHTEADQARARALLADIRSGRSSTCPFPIIDAQGRAIPVETRTLHGNWNGEPALIAIAQDIRERLAAEARQKLAASVFDNAHEGIMITDPAGRIVEVNGTFTELTGYSRDEALGQAADLLKSGHHDAEFYREMWRIIREHGYWQGEVWNRKKDGEIFVEQLTISTVHDRDGAISNFVGIFSDITLLKEHQQRLERLAHFDALTQLPNRMLLGDRMQLAMAQAERSNRALAVCYLDLDGFKPVNDTFGHATGDRLLIEVGQRLRQCVRGGDTVARLGGDEFVLLLGGLQDEHECDIAIARVISSLSQPFLVGSHTITISASIGVTLYPLDGSDTDTLLRHADQAMYEAKESGRNRYHLFDPESDRRARLRRDEMSAIREGLQRREFVLYYQPKVNMREGKVVGLEALIRWQHPERGVLAPAHFLPSIEGSELEIDIGNWVLEESLNQLSTWHAAGIALPVSVNIAGNHLQSAHFAQHLEHLLATHNDVPASLLELEILETAALEDIGSMSKLFAECARLGIQFALDDFGTGYSSLTYFRRLPAEVLKIDQSFVRDMLDDPDDLAIVEGVIGLTQAFRRKVIAEGVETPEHGLVLLQLGCDVAQGYGIARPMPASAVPDWISHFQPDTLWNAVTAFRWSREDLPMLIADVEHQRWTHQFLAHLAHAEDDAPIIEPHVCRLGRWYNSPQSERYRHIDCFEQLGEAHLQLHDIARQLAQTPASHSEARATLSQALRDASQQISHYIEQIQAEMLMNQAIGR